MDDLISRQAAIDAVNSIDNLDAKARGGICINLMGLPSAQPERKKGTWINEGRIIRCNRCKIGYATVKGMKSALTYNFCPNCGADMRGEGHE